MQRKLKICRRSADILKKMSRGGESAKKNMYEGRQFFSIPTPQDLKWNNPQ